MSVTAKSSRADCVAAYTDKMGVAPAAGWNRVEIIRNMENGVMPRSAKGKAAAVQMYVAATGFAPAKSWTAAQCVANAKIGHVTHSKPGSGTTVVELRKEASERGIAGRSKMNKAQLIAAIAASKAENRRVA